MEEVAIKDSSPHMHLPGAPLDLAAHIIHLATTEPTVDVVHQIILLCATILMTVLIELRLLWDQECTACDLEDLSLAFSHLRSSLLPTILI
jgi:hypothetical protein